MAEEDQVAEEEEDEGEEEAEVITKAKRQNLKVKMRKRMVGSMFYSFRVLLAPYCLHVTILIIYLLFLF